MIDGVMRVLVKAQSIVASDLQANFKNLSISQFERTDTLNGDLRIAWLKNGTTTNSAISNNQLNLHSSDTGRTVISGLQIQRESDTSNSVETLSIQYQAASDQLTGRMRVTTLQQLL